jgi:serine/threonine-protein kinase
MMVPFDGGPMFDAAGFDAASLPVIAMPQFDAASIPPFQGFDAASIPKTFPSTMPSGFPTAIPGWPPPSSRGMRVLPRAFGRYTLFDHIGKGGMAEIYLARAETELGGSRLAVVKQILFEYADLPEFAEMLTYEAKLAANLNHANVVQVFDLGRADGHLFIAMEYVEGFDLNNLLRRCSKHKVPLPMEFALHIVISALRGLDYAHRRTDDFGKPLGIVHRDVSPSNLLISFEGEVKVCDFGIAHANDLVKFAGATVDEAIKGKAGYMSPEHAAGEVIDARADVFAAGIVLWELLAGRRMYRQDQTRTSLLEQARRAEIPKLPLRNVPGERELHGIVEKALARDRSKRYASAAAMLRDLETHAVGSGRLASPLKVGEWLVTHFGEDVMKQRKVRERAAAAIARGPLVVMTPIAPMIAAQLAEEMNRAMPGSVSRPPMRVASSNAPPPARAASTAPRAVSAPPAATSFEPEPASIGGKTVAYQDEAAAVAAALAAGPPPSYVAHEELAEALSELEEVPPEAEVAPEPSALDLPVLPAAESYESSDEMRLPAELADVAIAPPSLVGTSFDVGPPSVSNTDLEPRPSTAPVMPRRRRKSSVFAVLLLLVVVGFAAAWYLRLLG